MRQLLRFDFIDEKLVSDESTCSQPRCGVGIFGCCPECQNLQQSTACLSNFPTPPTNLLLQPDDHTPQSREIWHVRWEKYCVKKREKYTFPTPPAASWPHTSKHLQTHTVSLIFSKSNLALSSCCLSGWVLCFTRAMQAGVKCHSTRLPKTCPHIFQHLNDQSRP